MRSTPEEGADQAPATEGSGLSFGTAIRIQKFSVSYEFPVAFTAGLFDPENRVLIDALCRLEPDRRHRCIVFLDNGLLDVRPSLCAELQRYAEAHSSRMELVTDPVAIPGGEKVKIELHFVEHMQRQLFEHRIDRHSYVIAIGGGAVLDAVGLVAATTHRGVRLVRVPTTVLAQNDSGVGVKNSVNLFDQKNFVGTFSPPFAVLNDIDFVELLPPREKKAGMAEAVKVALIRDAEFFRWLQRHADDLIVFAPSAMAYMIRRCAELHMRQIGQAGDPFETGSARPLDFGHWAAHRLETLTRYHVRHGEAVAVGMALDARYSVLTGLLDPVAEEQIQFLLEHLGFQLWHPALEKTMPNGRPAVLEGLREFREHLGGELTITLLSDIGVGVEVHEMDETLVLRGIHDLKQRAAG
jgi:3-dehydroquinate synthase